MSPVRPRFHRRTGAPPGAPAVPETTRPGTAAGLRELADLVLDVLRADGLVPAPAGATLAAPAGSAPGRYAMAAETVALSGRSRSTTAGGRPPAGEDTDEVAVEAEHAEVWGLVRAAQSGDGEAFGRLYDRYADTVYRYIYFRVGERTLAEDFTSETFLRALRRIGGISYQGRDIGAWFVTIARNIVLDHLKSARHRLEVTTGEVLDGDVAAPGPESAVLQALDARRLIAAVKQLGDEQRECIVLRFIQGLSVSETAEAMGKNDGAIKALQHRAVRKLADLVGAELR